MIGAIDHYHFDIVPGLLCGGCESATLIDEPRRFLCPRGNDHINAGRNLIASDGKALRCPVVKTQGRKAFDSEQRDKIEYPADEHQSAWQRRGAAGPRKPSGKMSARRVADDGDPPGVNVQVRSLDYAAIVNLANIPDQLRQRKMRRQAVTGAGIGKPCTVEGRGREGANILAALKPEAAVQE